jgi:predicted MFS family arabinose efflux permease
VAFFSPAWQANIPSLVPTNLVPGAVSLTSASAGLATALGPALGGIIVAIVGPGWAFCAAAIGYTTLLIAAHASQDVEWNRERGSMGIAIATGLRYLRFSRNYMWLLLVGSLFGFTSAALRSMLPNLTSDVLGGDSTLYGTLLGVFGAGALLGGLSRSFAERLFGGRVIPVCIVLFGTFGVVVGVSTLAWATAIAITFSGLLWTWILSTLSSTFQLLTPNWVRGRTMSAFVLSVFGFLPLGAIAAGAIGESFGADSSLVVFSLLTIAVGGIASWMPLPALEDIDPPVVPTSSDDAVPEAGTAAKPVMVTNSWTIEEESFDAAVELLAELRLLRLSTGAYHWAAYRSAKDLTRVTEVFMLHSWDHHLQQHRRLDLEALEVIGRMERSGVPGSLVRDHLVAFDVDHPARRPAWQHFLAEHEKMHLPHIGGIDQQ